MQFSTQTLLIAHTTAAAGLALAPSQRAVADSAPTQLLAGGLSVPDAPPAVTHSFADATGEFMSSAGTLLLDWYQLAGSEIAAGACLAGLGIGVLALWRRRGRNTPNSAILESLPDAIALFDTKGRLTAANRKLLALFPMEVSDDELLHSTSFDVYANLSPDNLAIERARNRARDKQNPDATLAFELASYGRSSLLVKERQTEDGGTAIAVYPNQSTSGSASRYDPLTALPTRTHLVSVLAQRCARTDNRLALLIVDLKSFRQINDTYGRTAGDELLKQTAICLQHAMPETALIARTAGDEFAVLLEFAGAQDDIERRVHEMLGLLRGGLKVNSMTVPVRASVGIAYAPEHGNTVSALLTAADSACAHAKRLGNNKLVVYNSTRQQKAKRDHQLEIGLQRAIDNDELSLQYQPQVDLRTQRTCGMEALLRWNSTEFGNVSPADFIPIAEQTGIISHIGAWVLDRAVADYQRLAQFGGSPTTLSVNLSRKQFDTRRIVGDIADMFERTGFNPDNLCLEITETALFDDASSLTGILNELTGLGAKIAIDDFGVGYSSLLELRDFPISEVKIDRAFITDITTNANSQDIVHAVVDIARSIGADVVAEGIETQEQCDTVAALGCDRVQGYFLCRPMRATTFPDLMLAS